MTTTPPTPRTPNARLELLRNAIHEQHWARVWTLAYPRETLDDPILWDYLQHHMGPTWCANRKTIAPHKPSPSNKDLRRLPTTFSFTNTDLRGANLSHNSLALFNLSNTDLRGANLIRASLFFTNLQGANLQGADLRGARLNNTLHNEHTLWPSSFNPTTSDSLGPHTHLTRQTIPPYLHNHTLLDLSHARLHEISGLYSRTLPHANFSHAHLSCTNFTNSTLTHANFSRSTIRRCYFTNTNLSNSDFGHTHISDTVLRHTNFSHANLSNLSLHQTTFDTCNFTNTNLSNTHLSRITLSQNPSLQHANTAHSNLSNNNLNNLTLQNLTLSHVDLTNTTLHNTTFDHVDLSHVDLSNTDLTTTTFLHCDLSHANLSNTTPHTHATFQHCTLPPHFTPTQPNLLQRLSLWTRNTIRTHKKRP